MNRALERGFDTLKLLMFNFISYRMIKVFEPFDAEGHFSFELHGPFQLAAHRRHVAIDEGFALVLK
jgi:hypothetical protein